jgi:hypothetical protein
VNQFDDEFSVKILTKDLSISRYPIRDEGITDVTELNETDSNINLTS